MTKDDRIAMYFSGKKLYGDDFNEREIGEWFKDEAEAYADLGAKDKDGYTYCYHALNWLYGYRYLKGDKFRHALGLGSAYGDELIPISDQIDRISIVDSSDAFDVSDVAGTPVAYFKARETGDLPFEDGTFDLVTCFGVLHHIPNVSYVVREVYRCMATDGIALVREPTTSMGDFRKPRRGLTKRERGIPHTLLREIFEQAGFSIERVSDCFFPLTPRIWKPLGVKPYNSGIATRVDRWLSRAFRWNYRYHRTTLISKFSPGAAFWFLRK